ncbi:hypothetical protein Indivirus_2_79 [Indivirus ILV1]|uniref:Uncharacterized protein n=1 Tax=Indivirus ILV1 TaxID=1977633 RepID=A0A1V0SDA0_9VIRU|nr:hypothetical protein Indivirus_2_79 [Indivirus ILV1]
MTKERLSFIEKATLHDILIKKWNRTLKILFEIGYYDSAPKWYWSALKETLEHADEISNYIPENEIVELDNIAYHEQCKNIEMDRMENLDEIPIIEVCWKLLDKLYDKIQNKNLYYVRKGLLYVFNRIYNEYELKYE